MVANMSFPFAPEVRDNITGQVRSLIMTSRAIRALMFDNAPDSEVLPFVNTMIDQLNDPKNEHGIWAVIEICARADTEWHPSPVVKVGEDVFRVGGWDEVILTLMLSHGGDEIERRILKGRAHQRVKDPVAHEHVRSKSNGSTRLTARINALLRTFVRAGLVERGELTVKIIDRAGLQRVLDTRLLPFDRIKERENDHGSEDSDH